jgi:hypothetical protein
VLLVETPNELVVAVSLTSAVSWTEVKLLVVTTLLVVGSAASLFKVWLVVRSAASEEALAAAAADISAMVSLEYAAPARIMSPSSAFGARAWCRRRADWAGELARARGTTRRLMEKKSMMEGACG